MMPGILNYKKKFYTLILLFIVLLIAAYKLAISKTIDEYRQYSDLKKKKENAKNIPGEIKELQSRLEAIDRHIIRLDTAINNFRQFLLEETSRFCQKNRLALMEFSQPMHMAEGEFEIESNKIVVKGGFHQLLKYVYFLETKEGGGKLASATFSSQVNRKDNSKYLTVTVIVQNIKKIEG